MSLEELFQFIGVIVAGKRSPWLLSETQRAAWCHMQLIPMIISSRMRSKMGDLATTNQIIPLLWKAWTLQECPTEDKKEQLSYLCQGMLEMWQPQQLWECMLRQNQTKIKEGRKCLFYAQHTAVQQVLVKIMEGIKSPWTTTNTATSLNTGSDNLQSCCHS